MTLIQALRQCHHFDHLLGALPDVHAHPSFEAYARAHGIETEEHAKAHLRARIAVLRHNAGVFTRDIGRELIAFVDELKEASDAG